MTTIPVPILVLFGAMFLAFLTPFVVALLTRRKIDPFEMSVVFTANYFLGFWLKPLMAMLDPDRYSAVWNRRTSYSDDVVVTGLFFALMGIIAFYVGYYLPLGKRLGRSLPRPSWPWTPTRVLMAVVVFGILSVMTFMFFVKRGHYSLSYMVMNRGEIVAGVGLIAWMFTLSSLVVFLVLFVYRMQVLKSQAARIVTGLGAIGIALAIMSIFGSRGNLLLVIGSAVMVRHYCIKRLSLATTMLLGLAVIVFSATIFAMRSWVLVGESPPFHRATDAIVADLVSVSTGWEGFLMVLESYPDQHPYYYGAIVAGDFMWLIPRLFWQDKPTEYGGFLVQRDLLPDLRSADTGLGTYESFSPLGYGYADLGIIGMLFAMFSHGAFWRTIYEYLRYSKYAPPAAAAYGLLVLSLSTYARGFVGSFLAVLVFWLPILYVVRWLGQRGLSFPVVRMAPVMRKV